MKIRGVNWPIRVDQALISGEMVFPGFQITT
jgi:hypothetical protein